MDIYYSPKALDERIGEFRPYNNHHRYHEAIDNVTPYDRYIGRDRQILAQRKKTKAETMKNRQLSKFFDDAQIRVAETPICMNKDVRICVRIPANAA